VEVSEASMDSYLASQSELENYEYNNHDYDSYYELTGPELELQEMEWIEYLNSIDLSLDTDYISLSTCLN